MLSKVLDMQKNSLHLGVYSGSLASHFPLQITNSKSELFGT